MVIAGDPQGDLKREEERWGKRDPRWSTPRSSIFHDIRSSSSVSAERGLHSQLLLSANQTNETSEGADSPKRARDVSNIYHDSTNRDRRKGTPHR